MELLGHVVTLFRFLMHHHTAFQKWLHHFTIPTVMYEGFGSPTSPPTLVIVRVSDYSHCSECEIVFHCDFDLHPLMITDIQYVLYAY